MPLRQIAFHLTDRCQLDCRHCLRDPGKRPLDLDPLLVDRVVGQTVRLYDCTHVGLTGGEPVLHPRLAEVVDAVVRHGATWHVVTSGNRFEVLLALLAAGARRREALRSVDLSLDGPRAEVHDAIRGPGSFREVMAAAARCKADEIPFSFQTTLHAVNVDTIEEVGLAASHLGARQLMFSLMQATGTEGDRELFLRPAALRAVRDRVVRLADALKLSVGMAEGFPLQERFHVCVAHTTETMHVDPRGRLSLCCQLSGTPGGDGSDAVAELAEVDLVEGHRRVLELIHRSQARRLAEIAAGPGDAWDRFPCNVCLRSFGKPYWTDDGAAGPAASRGRRTGTTV
jgi:MoaA/NifB/PqqE/SkfB family radical SAM enzyme